MQDTQEIHKEGEPEILPPIDEKDLKILQDMMKAGLMYGHRKSKTDPRFKPYIYITRNGIEIIDLHQTLECLEKAAEFIKTKIEGKGLILVVGTQPAAQETARALAKKFGFAYVNERWIGGSLTNFKVISKRIEYFKKLQSDSEKGLLDKYTKKERVVINRKIERMKRMFTGLEDLTHMPDAMIIIDPSLKGHATALREAKIMNIPAVAILDNDGNPDLVQYPIPGNDHAKSSIEWIVNTMAEKLNEERLEIKNPSE